jgi:hypothetical protein
MSPALDDSAVVWTQAVASVLFLRLVALNDYDEDAAYAQLIAKGCPAHLADAAWESWAQGGGA